MVSFEPLAIDEANAFLDASIRDFVSERVPADDVDAVDLYESLGFLTTRRDDTDCEMRVEISPLFT